MINNTKYISKKNLMLHNNYNWTERMSSLLFLNYINYKFNMTLIMF